MKYYINGIVSGLLTDSQKLGVLIWLKDNYTNQVETAKARGDTETVTFQIIIDSTFQDMVNVITALKAEYSDDLEWELDAQDYGG